MIVSCEPSLAFKSPTDSGLDRAKCVDSTALEEPPATPQVARRADDVHSATTRGVTASGNRNGIGNIKIHSVIDGAFDGTRSAKEGGKLGASKSRTNAASLTTSARNR